MSFKKNSEENKNIQFNLINFFFPHFRWKIPVDNIYKNKHSNQHFIYKTRANRHLIFKTKKKINIGLLRREKKMIVKTLT